MQGNLFVIRAIKYLIGRIPNPGVYMYFKENLAHGRLNLATSCLSNDFFGWFCVFATCAKLFG